MSDKITIPESQAIIETADTIRPGPLGPNTQAVTNKKNSPRFVSALDLNSVVRILAAADKIPPEEAVRRLDQMCEEGLLVIVPPFGGRK